MADGGEKINVSVKSSAPKKAKPKIQLEKRERLEEKPHTSEKSNPSAPEKEAPPPPPARNTKTVTPASPTETTQDYIEEPATEDDLQPSTTVADLATHTTTIDAHEARDYRIAKRELKKPPASRRSHIVPTTLAFTAIVVALLVGLYVAYPDIFWNIFE